MREKILEFLRQAEGYISGQELCERLGVSRTAVWKNIKILRQAGYEIEAVSNRGYKLLKSPDLVGQQDLRPYICSEIMGRDIYVRDRVDSTNTWAKQLAEENAVHGSLAVADEQTAGKGRRGRGWVTPKGTVAAFTLLLKPEKLIPENASMLTLIMGLSVAKAIRELYGLKAGIKWPNDVVVSGKKICGILTEMSVQIDYINYIVIGTGINANLENFPEDIEDKATSLYLELGEKIRRAPLIGNVLGHFENYYTVFLEKGDLSDLMGEYNEILLNCHKEVRVLQPAGEYTGVARGINGRGELLVEKEDGTVCEVYAGEVSVRGLYSYV